MKSKYSHDDLCKLLFTIIPDWTEWIVNPISRVDLLTSAAEIAEPRGVLRADLRKYVDYTGAVNKTCSTLWDTLEQYDRGNITSKLDEFVDALMITFQSRLDRNEPNNQRIYEEVERIRSRYQ
jgi:hypothetical protein